MTKTADIESLLETAIQAVWREGKASTSFIQRTLSIGYNKAAHLMERMEEMAVVSAADSTGKREVYSPKAMLHALKIRNIAIEMVGEKEGVDLIREVLAAIKKETVLDQAAETSIAKIEEAARKGRPPMKEDPDFKEHNQETYRITASELREIVERYERLQEDKDAIGDQQKEVMASAKARGYDTPTVRRLLKLRKKDANQIAEEDALLDMYREALGI